MQNRGVVAVPARVVTFRHVNVLKTRFCMNNAARDRFQWIPDVGVMQNDVVD